MNIGLEYKDIPKIRKEPRFGLNRIGPATVVVNPGLANHPLGHGGPPYYDLWFDGETPDVSDTLITCGSDYKRDGTLHPDNAPITLCHHYFSHRGTKSGVRLTYWKIYHEHWRNIQERVTALLDSFKNPPPAKD